jgi:hypothetical protein
MIHFRANVLAWASLGSLFLLSGCPEQPAVPLAAGPKPDTVCPKGLPSECKVLRDEFDEKKLVAKYHVLVPKGTKHDDADAYLKALYRYLWMRRDVTPTQVGAYVYTDEAQFSTPPESPVAVVTQNPSDKSPTFENKIALELWQQVEQAIKLSARADRKLKRKLEYVAEPDKGLVTVIMPFTAGMTEEWAPDLDYSQAIAYFSELSQQLFNNIPELKVFLYRARWKDQDVVQIELSKADYDRIGLAQVEQRIGQLAGRTFLELATGKGGSEASVEKSHNRRRAAEYKKAIDQIKGKVLISPLLKP